MTSHHAAKTSEYRDTARHGRGRRWRKDVQGHGVGLGTEQPEAGGLHGERVWKGTAAAATAVAATAVAAAGVLHGLALHASDITCERKHKLSLRKKVPDTGLRWAAEYVCT